MREAGLAVVREMMSKSSQPSRGLSDSTVSANSSTESAPSSSVTISSHGANSADDIMSSTSPIGKNDISNGAEDDYNDVTAPVCISSRHFEAALNRVRPSVALHDRQR